MLRLRELKRCDFEGFVVELAFRASEHTAGVRYADELVADSRPLPISVGNFSASVYFHRSAKAMEEALGIECAATAAAQRAQHVRSPGCATGAHRQPGEAAGSSRSCVPRRADAVREQQLRALVARLASKGGETADVRGVR